MTVRAVLVAALATIVACSLTTDFDQFDKGGSGGSSSSSSGDSGPAATTEGGALLPDGGKAAPVCDASTRFSDDPKNCGFCGHDCLGGGCARGKCQPIILADDIESPNGVVLTTAGMYIGADDGLLLLAPGSTHPKHLTDGAPQFLAATATDVFYADYPMKAIRRIGIGSTDAVTIKDSIEEAAAIALSPTTIFFAREDGTAIESIPFTTTLTTATQDIVVPSWPKANGIDWANGKLYVASFADNSVYEIPNDGKAIAQKRSLLLNDCRAFGVKIDGPDAFITCGDGQLERVRLDGSEQPEVLLEGLDGPSGLAVTADAIYVCENDGGRVIKVAR